VRIAVRVDASPDVGAGHLYRCLSLIRVLRERGHTIQILAGLEPGFQITDVGAIDGELIRVPLNLPEPEDAAFLTSQVHEVDVVIVDRPGFGESWERMARSISSRIVAIDDRPGSRHDVDVLISTAAFVDQDRPFDGFVTHGTRILVGPTHLPLRPEFQARELSRRTKVLRIAAFFGGSDPGDQIQHVLDWAGTDSSRELQFRVVAGALNTRLEEWQSRSRSMRNVEVYEQVDNVAELWDWADLGIGSYGMAAWERCARGLPTISTVQVEEQVDDARFLIGVGAVLDIGWAGELTAARLESAYMTIASSPWQLESMSAAAARIMSNRGEDVASLLAAITGD